MAPTASPAASYPLPVHVLHALAKLARDLRDVPRDCIRDRHELVHWLSRQARRAEAIATSRIVLARPQVLVVAAPAPARSPVPKRKTTRRALMAAAGQLELALD